MSRRPTISNNPARGFRPPGGWSVHLGVWALVAVLYISGALQFIDYQFTDWRFRLTQRPVTGNLVMVEIDAESIASLDTWPWPRRYHAKVLDRLLAAGADRVAIDVDFSAKSNPKDDALFAAALKRAQGRVILPASTQPVSRIGQSDLHTTAFPLGQFRDSVSLASIVVHPATDSSIRSLDVDYMIGDARMATLSARLAEAGDMASATYSIDYGIDLSTIERISFADVLSGQFDPALVAGKQVLIGGTAAELGEQFAVPVYLTLPGPLIHALGYESLAQGRALKHLAPAPALAILLIFTLVAGRLFAGASWQRGVVTFGAILIGGFLISLAVQSTWPVIIDVTPWILAATLVFLLELIRRVDRQSVQLLFQNLDLRRKDIMMRHVVDNSIVGILTFTLDGTIESINPAAERMFGYRASEIEGKNFSTLMGGSATIESASDLLRVSQGGHEMTAQRKDGAAFSIEISTSIVNLEDRQICTAFISDVTERKQQQALADQAMHDSLTGLPNRSKFLEGLNEAVAETEQNGRMLSVLLLDLDRFKPINDTFGHPTGDRLLQEISQRLTDMMPEKAIFARIGGDEFAILLPEVVGIAAAQDFAQFVIDELERPYLVDGNDLNVGGSIGIAVYPQHGANAQELVQRADVAMYAAKRNRRGTEIYSPKSDPNSLRNVSFTGDLRRAIENNLLDLAFQPKLDLRTNKLTGVEALSRWMRPEHGLVSPEDFVTHAEQFGLMMPLTKWMMNAALEQGATWRRQGLDLNIAINLSAGLLHHAKLVPTVHMLLRKWKYPASRLTIEITENALLVNPDDARRVVGELAELGVRIAIDDFGTGYSSLSYLRMLSAHELKIDKSFVMEINESTADHAIVRSVIAMAHELGLDVVAEGIETQAALDLLGQSDCDIGQGFLMGRPMSAPDFEVWVREHHAIRSTAVEDTAPTDPPADQGEVVTLATHPKRNIA